MKEGFTFNSASLKLLEKFTFKNFDGGGKQKRFENKTKRSIEFRDEYKKSVADRYLPQVGAAVSPHRGTSAPPPQTSAQKQNLPPPDVSTASKTRIFYCRRPSANWDKSEFEVCKAEFREIQQELLAPFTFEKQIHQETYKGLIKRDRDALRDPIFNATNLPRLHKRKLTLTKKYRPFASYSRSANTSNVSKKSYEISPSGT